LAEHPLRLGLSMSVDVAVRNQDGPSLAAARKIVQPVLTTLAYQKQLNDADALITQIIERNLPASARH
jgi:membrane fusion protein (multidrug efflux system)